MAFDAPEVTVLTVECLTLGVLFFFELALVVKATIGAVDAFVAAFFVDVDAATVFFLLLVLEATFLVDVAFFVDAAFFVDGDLTTLIAVATALALALADGTAILTAFATGAYSDPAACTTPGWSEQGSGLAVAKRAREESATAVKNEERMMEGVRGGEGKTKVEGVEGVGGGTRGLSHRGCLLRTRRRESEINGRERRSTRRCGRAPHSEVVDDPSRRKKLGRDLFVLDPSHEPFYDAPPTRFVMA